MSVFDKVAEARRVADNYARMAKAAPPGDPARVASQARSDRRRSNSLEGHAEQYRHNSGWVHACNRIIAARVADRPFVLARGVSAGESVGSRPLMPRSKADPRLLVKDKGTIPEAIRGIAADFQVIESHEVLDAVNRPNPFMVRSSLMNCTTQSLELTGKGYWWPFRNPDDRERMNIWYLPAHWVKPVHGEKRPFESWEVRPPGVSEPIKVKGDGLIYFSIPDPGNPTSALGPLSAQALGVVADEAIATAQTRGFINSLWPGLAFIVRRIHNDQTVADDGEPTRPVLTANQRRSIVNMLKAAYRGIINYDEPLILDGMIEDVKPVSRSNREMDFRDSSRVTKARVTQGFGVNPLSMGEVEGSNRSSSAVADSHLLTNTVNPILTLISECVTAWLLPMFDGTEGMVAYLEHAYPQDPELELKKWTAQTISPAVTVNEYRVHVLHKPPVAGGDVLLIPQNLKAVPAGAAIRPEPEPEPEPEGESHHLGNGRA